VTPQFLMRHPFAAINFAMRAGMRFKVSVMKDLLAAARTCFLSKTAHLAKLSICARMSCYSFRYCGLCCFPRQRCCQPHVVSWRFQHTCCSNRCVNHMAGHAGRSRLSQSSRIELAGSRIHGLKPRVHFSLCRSRQPPTQRKVHARVATC